MTRCEYCMKFTDDTAKCQIKSAFYIGAKWNPRVMNICKRCRKYLHGFFKYTNVKEERIKKERRMKDDQLKWEMFRREMQKLREVQQALLRLGETMVVGVWWITKAHDVVTFDPDFMDLRKGTAMNKFDHKEVNIRELLRSP